MNDKPIYQVSLLLATIRPAQGPGQHLECHFTLRRVIPRPMSKLLQVEKNETT